MSKNYEENQELELLTEDLEGIEVTELEPSSGRKGLTAVVVGGVVVLGGLAVAGIKKLKNKNADGTKKPKTKLKLVRVPVEEDVEVVDTDAEVVDEVETEK